MHSLSVAKKAPRLFGSGQRVIIYQFRLFDPAVRIDFVESVEEAFNESEESLENTPKGLISLHSDIHGHFLLSKI